LGRIVSAAGYAGETSKSEKTLGSQSKATRIPKRATIPSTLPN